MSDYVFNLNDFYGILADAVRHSPIVQDQPCKRLQTWLVETEEGGRSLQTPNLGATICDKGKNFFWSRLWADMGYPKDKIEFDFPVLSCFVQSIRTNEPFARNKWKNLYNISLSVTDALKNDCKDCDCCACDKRTKNDLFLDTSRLLDQVIFYLQGVKVARIDGGPWGLYHSQYLEALLDIGGITVETGRGFSEMLSANNQQQNGIYTEGFATSLYGRSIDLVVQENVCFEDLTFNFEEFPAAVIEDPCCRTPVLPGFTFKTFLNSLESYANDEDARENGLSTGQFYWFSQSTDEGIYDTLKRVSPL